jgi:hypothetical protein
VSEGNTTPPPLATWLLGLFAPRRDVEMILGDLAEEHGLLASTLPAAEASRWYWRQVLCSAGPLIWRAVRRGVWLKTLGAALAGYFVVMVAVMAADLVMTRRLSVSETVYALISLAVGFPVMALGGYIAACLRPTAAGALAAIAAVMGVVSLAATGGAAPLWYQLALIVLGPAGALAGGRIRLRQRRQSRA